MVGLVGCGRIVSYGGGHGRVVSYGGGCGRVVSYALTVTVELFLNAKQVNPANILVNFFWIILTCPVPSSLSLDPQCPDLFQPPDTLTVLLRARAA